METIPRGSRRNLINRVEFIAEGKGWREKKNGLHELEFIETAGIGSPKKSTKRVGVNVLNLVNLPENNRGEPGSYF